VNYFDAQTAAEVYGLDYNKFCAAVGCMEILGQIRARDMETLARFAQDRIFDLLLPEDGYAAKEARKYLERYRPDLIARLTEAEGRP
jgi:hypothetical protein